MGSYEIPQPVGSILHALLPVDLGRPIHLTFDQADVQDIDWHVGAFRIAIDPQRCFFSPECPPISSGEERDHQLPGGKYVLKLQKPVSSTYHLHVRLGNRIVLRVLVSFQKFFRAECNPTMRFGHIAHSLIHYSGYSRLPIFVKHTHKAA